MCDPVFDRAIRFLLDKKSEMCEKFEIFIDILRTVDGQAFFLPCSDDDVEVMALGREGADSHTSKLDLDTYQRIFYHQSQPFPL